MKRRIVGVVGGSCVVVGHLLCEMLNVLVIEQSTAAMTISVPASPWNA
jgi:hypothetical protein